MDVAGFLGLSRFWRLTFEVAAVPGALHALLRSELVENAVAAEYYEIVVLRDLELLNVGVSNDDVRIAASELQLRLWVSKSPADLEMRD